MKNLIAVLWVLGLANMAIAQKTIKGKVYFPKHNKSEMVQECDYYQVSLKKQRYSGERDTLAVMESAAFGFTLSKEQLKKYKFIEFVQLPSDFDAESTERFIKLKDIVPDSIDVVLRDPYSVRQRHRNSEINVYKPAIYLYPERETTVFVKHTFNGTVLNTFPEYNDGWKVQANPDGKLKNLSDGRSYSYLFWDGSTRFTASHFQYKNGFYIARKEVVPFLQQRLAHIGLNETEINDFIVYWLPLLNENEINFIHFWVNDDIDHSSKLEVTPQPETIIRVFMEYKAYDGKSAKLPEQKLPATARKGFTLVEWGGGAIGTSRVE